MDKDQRVCVWGVIAKDDKDVLSIVKKKITKGDSQEGWNYKVVGKDDKCDYAYIKTEKHDDATFKEANKCTWSDAYAWKCKAVTDKESWDDLKAKDSKFDVCLKKLVPTKVDTHCDHEPNHNDAKLMEHAKKQLNYVAVPGKKYSMVTYNPKDTKATEKGGCFAGVKISDECENDDGCYPDLAFNPDLKAIQKTLTIPKGE